MLLQITDDLSLWLRFKNGDKEAFAALYQKHIISLLAYGHKLCNDQEILKDTIQELFIEIWNARQSLAKTDSVKFYLFKALRYKLIRFEKRNHAQARSLRSVADLLYSPASDPIEASIIDRESSNSRIAMLREAIKGLTLRQQEIIQLRFYQGFTNEQIAGLLDMNYQSVSNLVYNSICRLKKKIKNPAFTTALLVLCSLIC